MQWQLATIALSVNWHLLTALQPMTCQKHKHACVKNHMLALLSSCNKMQQQACPDLLHIYLYSMLYACTDVLIELLVHLSYMCACAHCILLVACPYLQSETCFEFIILMNQA